MLVATCSVHTPVMYTSDVEEILKFKNFTGFKKQVACKTANN
jgi:hypothetical protein